MAEDESGGDQEMSKLIYDPENVKVFLNGVEIIPYGETPSQPSHYQSVTPLSDTEEKRKHRDWCNWKMNPSIGNEETFCNCDAGHKD